MRRCSKGAARCWGFLSFAPYSEQHVRLDIGDMLVMYSDGVTEANNSNYDEFAEDRFIEVLRKYRNEPSTKSWRRLSKALNDFAAGAPQADDITLLVAKRV